MHVIFIFLPFALYFRWAYGILLWEMVTFGMYTLRFGAIAYIYDCTLQFYAFWQFFFLR